MVTESNLDFLNRRGRPWLHFKPVQNGVGHFDFFNPDFAWQLGQELQKWRTPGRANKTPAMSTEEASHGCTRLGASNGPAELFLNQKREPINIPLYVALGGYVYYTLQTQFIVRDTWGNWGKESQIISNISNHYVCYFCSIWHLLNIFFVS